MNNILITHNSGPIDKSIFNYYNNEFISQSHKINENIVMLKDNYTNKSLITSTEQLFIDIYEIIKQIQNEVRSFDNVTKKELSDRYIQHKKNIDLLNNDFKKICSDFNKNLLVENSTSNNHRQRMLNTNNQLINQTKTIENSTRLVDEITNVSIDISVELKKNHEKINSVQNHICNFKDITDAARKIVSSMNKRSF